MRFLIDRCAGRLIADWLRKQGHDVVESRELGPDPGDRALLDWAAKETRILITIMDPWYRIATPRKEVREGRSFSPDEFAIALEQVIAGTALKIIDCRRSFSRTYFSRALTDHSGMVLRRLAGKTENTSPVMGSWFSRGREQVIRSLACGLQAKLNPGWAGKARPREWHFYAFRLVFKHWCVICFTFSSR